MIQMKATEIASIVGGVLHGSDVEVTAPAFVASKECVDGSIFLAIKGSHVDGHDFVADAFDHGAVLAFVTHQISERCIVVGDVTQAVSEKQQQKICSTQFCLVKDRQLRHAEITIMNLEYR